MMFNKKLISLVPEAMPIIIKKVVIMWLSMVCNIVVWFLLARLIERVYSEDAVQIGIVTVTSALILILVVIRFFTTRILAERSADIADKVKLDLRDKLYRKMTELGGDYKKIFSTAEITQLASEGVEQIEIYFTQYLPQLFYSVLAPITLFFIFLPISWKTALILLVCVPLIPVAIASVQTVAKKLLSKYWDAYANLGDSFLENLQGLTTLKIYGADGEKHRQMNREAENFRKITMKVLSMQLNSVTIMDVAAYGGAAMGMLVCYFDFAASGMPLYGALAVIFLASEFFIPMRLLGSYFHIAMNGVAASDKILKILNAKTPENGTKNISGGNIDIRNLCFSYDEKREILKDITMNIAENSIIGICGASGCGKSTLASIIAGRSRDYKGGLYFEKDEYSELKYEHIAENIMYIGCNDYIFSGSVRDCLSEAGKAIDEAAMYESLKCVSLFDFVMQNGGLDMCIKQNASNLSGGQKQRLALARALLKPSEVYIFDEVTSNVDVESEKIILDVIYQMAQNHTVIIISHKLTNIAKSDTVYFMEDGKITEAGTHEELMAKGGKYSQIYSRQQQLEAYTGGGNK